MEESSWTVANCDGSEDAQTDCVSFVLNRNSPTAHKIPVEDMVYQLEEQLVQE